eukprot:4256644-Prymnesium_polylepis.1
MVGARRAQELTSEQRAAWQAKATAQNEADGLVVASAPEAAPAPAPAADAAGGWRRVPPP